MNVSQANETCQRHNTNNNRIIAICLMQKCKLSRPVCQECIMSGHKDHVDKCIPLSEIDLIRSQIQSYTVDSVYQAFKKLSDAISDELREIEHLIKSLGNSSNDLNAQYWNYSRLDQLGIAIRNTKYSNEPAALKRELIQNCTLEIVATLQCLKESLINGLSSPRTSNKFGYPHLECIQYKLKATHNTLQIVGDCKARNANNYSFETVYVDPPIHSGVAVLKFKLTDINLTNFIIGVIQDNQCIQIEQLSSDGVITQNQINKRQSDCKYKSGDILQITLNTELSNIEFLNITTNKMAIIEQMKQGDWQVKVVMTNSEIELLTD